MCSVQTYDGTTVPRILRSLFLVPAFAGTESYPYFDFVDTHQRPQAIRTIRSPIFQWISATREGHPLCGSLNMAGPNRTVSYETPRCLIVPIQIPRTSLVAGHSRSVPEPSPGHSHPIGLELAETAKARATEVTMWCENIAQLHPYETAFSGLSRGGRRVAFGKLKSAFINVYSRMITLPVRRRWLGNEQRLTNWRAQRAGPKTSSYLLIADCKVKNTQILRCWCSPY